MKRLCIILLCAFLVIMILPGCNINSLPKIGVAFGVGPAARWPLEKRFMEEYAQKLGVELEARLNTDEKAKPFNEDCIELIDSGIDVLIVRPRDDEGMTEVVAYAQKKNVKIISYASLIENSKVDLFVGYDCEYIGQKLGKFLSEMVIEGDYILLWGQPRNRTVEDMYRGAMKFIAPLEGDINILLDAGVPNWSPEEARKMVKEAVAANGNHVDAILCFNDKLAGASIEALNELGITDPVVVTGMDAEIDAVRRIVAGTQACTVYMDLKEVAHKAIDQAINLYQKKPLDVNYELDNNSGSPVQSSLIAGQMVTQSNLDRVLIESGYYTAQEIYDTTSVSP